MEIWRCVMRVSLAGLLVTACRHESAEPSQPTPIPAPSAGHGSAYRTPVCRELLSRYRKVQADASGTCRTSEECGLYGGVDPDDVCGGVTDMTAVRALRKVRADMDDAGCMALPYSCPALEAKCVRGQCEP